MSRLFTNNKVTLVHDAIDGILYSNKHNNLTRLDVEQAIDDALLELVDPAWSELVPAAWRLRMNGPD